MKHADAKWCGCPTCKPQNWQAPKLRYVESTRSFVEVEVEPVNLPCPEDCGDYPEHSRRLTVLHSPHSSWGVAYFD